MKHILCINKKSNKLCEDCKLFYSMKAPPPIPSLKYLDVMSESKIYILEFRVAYLMGKLFNLTQVTVTTFKTVTNLRKQWQQETGGTTRMF